MTAIAARSTKALERVEGRGWRKPHLRFRSDQGTLCGQRLDGHMAVVCAAEPDRDLCKACATFAYRWGLSDYAPW